MTGPVDVSEDTTDRLLTVAEAAQRLGTTERFPRRLIAQRRIAYTKLGSGRGSPVRIEAKDLEDWIKANRIEAAE